jgi:hypothetical protein
MRTIRYILKWCLILVASVFLGSLVVRAVAWYPQIRYERSIHEHSLDDDCRQVKAGADLHTTLQILARNGEPSLETIEGGRLIVRRGDISCKVQMDSAMQHVVTAEPQRDQYSFDPRNE